MAETTSTSPSSLSFEKALETLQATVKRLESGELTLEQALKSFEEGIALAKSCQEYLANAEKRIEILTQAHPNGTAETRPFED